MRSRNVNWLFALVAAAGSCCVGANQSLNAQGDDVLVMVVNKDNTVAAGMNMQEARRLLLGETLNWRNGAKVVVVLGPAGNGDRVAVLKKVCGMSEAAYTRFEMQASFTGQTPATVEVGSTDAAIRNTVRADPGAIGFIHKSQVDKTVQTALELP